jgi:MarR family transcriptional regulator, transcriptional regulator for hemolysin
MPPQGPSRQPPRQPPPPGSPLTLPGGPPGFRVPVGLRLTQVARVVERAFDEALAMAGGSLPTWLILLNLKVRKPPSQKELAEAVGLREATLTHHLAGMEQRGLVTRTRDAANRRVQVVALTQDGEDAFLRLRDAAIAFDARVRTGLADSDLDRLDVLLGVLAANVAGAPGPAGGPAQG